MSSRLLQFVPLFVVLAALLALGHWFAYGGRLPAFAARVPNQDRGANIAAAPAPKLTGVLTAGPGTPAALPGAWPAFRGANHDNVNTDPVPLAREWPSAGPTPLWGIDLGEGYAGAVVRQGRVYVLDYDQPGQQDVLRCLSLADGKEIWRYAYPLSVKRNHGITRTVPAVTEKVAVAMDPKCNVVCVDAASGTLRWGLNLVRDCGTAIPPWYAGQCPLIDGNTAILAPAGPDTLLMAVDLGTGKTLWKTPNPRGWKMTHSSVMPMEFAGRRMFVYCGSGGVVGVSAQDGSILWDSTDWKISIATVASPIPLADGRIFFSGGYRAGSLMLQLSQEGGKLVPKTVFKVAEAVFGATQQTPILYKDHIFGIRPDGQLACLDLTGKLVWASGPKTQFGLGPLVVAGGLLYAMNDTGKLCLFEASAAQCTPLAQADVFTEGHESWGPMALAGGRLIVRDFTRILCLDVEAH